MADEDEIDVLGDFSFNSCFAQNNQGMWVLQTVLLIKILSIIVAILI